MTLDPLSRLFSRGLSEQMVAKSESEPKEYIIFDKWVQYRLSVSDTLIT